MRLPADICRQRLTEARVGYLGTVGLDQVPHVVPITFSLVDDVLYTAVDQKPKTTTRLRRLRNIAENPRVTILVDHYADDWAQLWWVRADGSATILDDADARDAAIEALVAKYVQYRLHRPEGPALAIQVERLSGWAAASAQGV